MSSDYSAGLTIHRIGTAEMTPSDEAMVRKVVDAVREPEPGFPPPFDQFEFRYGTSAARDGMRDGIYIALSDYFIEDEDNDAPAEDLLQRDMPATEQLVAELQDRLGSEFVVAACYID